VEKDGGGTSVVPFDEPGTINLRLDANGLTIAVGDVGTQRPVPAGGSPDPGGKL